MRAKFTPVTCKLCSHVDKTTETHTGTSVMMRCSACCTEAEPYASLCRYCCPTNHGTYTNEGTARQVASKEFHKKAIAKL